MRATATPRAARTDERILDAAEQCMGTLGLSRVSMADVAQKAGVSRGAVYLHFGARASLVDAVLARVATRFFQSSEEFVRRRRTLAGQVAEAAAFVQHHARDRRVTLPFPGEEDSLLAALLTVRSDRLTDEWVGFWEPYLEDAERRGEVRPGLDRRAAGEWIVRLMLSFAVMAPVTFAREDADALRSFVKAHIVGGFAP